MIQTTARLLFWLIALQLAAPAAALDPAALQGSWSGTLAVQGVELRVVFHLTEADGEWSVTMDSPDQGVTGIPAAVAFEGDGLRIDVAAAGASFEGAVGEDGTVAGQWSQGGMSLPLVLERGTTGAAPAATFTEAQRKRLEGTWLGKLQAGVALRIVLRFEALPDGGIAGTLESPDQGDTRIPVADIALDGDRLDLAVRAVGGTFGGTLSEDGQTIDGEWKQAGQTMPLVVERVDHVEAPSRPQTPQGPVPYDVEDVAYESAEGVTIAGTLTLPRGEGRHPAVLLISGSGPQDRDEMLLQHRPFWVIADHLTRKGIAVLRVDDRGIGDSTGDFATATTRDFAADARAGVRLLKERGEIDPRRIGLVGHSEGGIVAPMVAADSDDVGFIVLLAGTGLPGDEILLLQTELIMKKNGASKELLKWNRRESRWLYELVKTEDDADTIRRKTEARFEERWPQLSPELRRQLEALGETKESIVAGVELLTSPWFRFFLSYDPRPTLERVRCPVLALNGERDLQVPPGENLAAIRKALKAGGNRDYTVEKLKGLNHLFQTAETGMPDEYGTIEQTIDPAVLERISGWILGRES